MKPFHIYNSLGKVKKLKEEMVIAYNVKTVNYNVEMMLIDFIEKI